MLRSGYVRQLTAGDLRRQVALAVSAVTVAVIVVALVMLWRPDASAYYTADNPCR